MGCRGCRSGCAHEERWEERREGCEDYRGGVGWGGGKVAGQTAQQDSTGVAFRGCSAQPSEPAVQCSAQAVQCGTLTCRCWRGGSTAPAGSRQLPGAPALQPHVSGERGGSWSTGQRRGGTSERQLLLTNPTSSTHQPPAPASTAHTPNHLQPTPAPTWVQLRGGSGRERRFLYRPPYSRRKKRRGSTRQHPPGSSCPTAPPVRPSR